MEWFKIASYEITSNRYISALTAQTTICVNLTTVNELCLSFWAACGDESMRLY